MCADFKSVKLEQFKIKPFNDIRFKWFLITAGKKDSFNSMTACWGGLGHLWDIHHVCFVFVRPTRYTYEFLEKSERFTIQFFEQKYQAKLKYLGTNSGRDTDKVKDVGFTPMTTKNGGIYYAESKVVIDCRKIYFQDIDPKNFLHSTVDIWYKKNYPDEGYHRMYVGGVEELLVKETSQLEYVDEYISAASSSAKTSSTG